MNDDNRLAEVRDIHNTGQICPALKISYADFLLPQIYYEIGK